MPQYVHYLIEYRLNGERKMFYIASENMDSIEAWHWASIDAGVGHIPKFRCDLTPKMRRPQAETFGITDVQWARA
ncbi:MAG TPA: DUF6555 family protein [Pseudomonas sp.]|uniref:DUF6555 family protein n=1 Tax=Pseudomonas sp. TaxID=306 RepID=UPI002ED8EACD